MHVMPVSKARANLYQLVDSISESHEEVLVMGKRNNLVLVSEADWRAIQETLHLMSIPGLKESIIEGMKADPDECSKELDW